jgi:hypothetical protein
VRKKRRAVIRANELGLKDGYNETRLHYGSYERALCDCEFDGWGRLKKVRKEEAHVNAVRL